MTVPGVYAQHVAKVASTDNPHYDDAAKVERMARAICAADGADPNEILRSSATLFIMYEGGGEWDNSCNLGASWRQWVPHATAALAALREMEGE